MARKRFVDNDDDYCGLVGGEVTDARFAGERGQEYDFGPVHDVSSRLSGEEYAYLGHFRRREFAREGHNDIQMPGLGALHVPEYTAGSSNMGALPRGPIGRRLDAMLNSAIDKGLSSLAGSSDGQGAGAAAPDASGGGDATGGLY